MANTDEVHRIVSGSGRRNTAVLAQESLESRAYLHDSLTNTGLSDTDPKYTIEKYEDNDDAGYVTTWRWWLHRILPLTTFVAVVAGLLYFVFRIRYTVQSQRASHSVYPMAWIFILVEAGVAVPNLLFQVLQSFSIIPRHRPRLRMTGNYLPRVDVFITCAGEEVEVILDTVKAACSVDWLRDRLRVIVLDDKNSEDLRVQVKLLALDNASIHYTAREKIPGVPHHYKAGNLNHGLRYTEDLPDGKADYVAALDADMIPESQWLRALLPHLINDAAVALVCPPQLFYNVPKNDALYQNLAFFSSCLEPAKDAVGSAWCTGSGYVVRRSALDGIGGFPVGSVAEDILCSSLLIAAGWKTCYVHEALQYGTVPDSFSGHIKQRTRWTLGSIQTSASLNFFLWGGVCRRMTFLQRFIGLAFTVATLTMIFTTISLILFPVVLVSGYRLVAYSNSDQLRWLIRLGFFALASSRLNVWIGFVPAGYRFAWRSDLMMFWMAPYHSIILIRFFLLPRWLGGKTASFTSTGSIESPLKERDIHARASLLRRLKVILWDGGVFMHLLYLLFTLGAVASSIARMFVRSGPRNAEDRLVYFLTHAGWPPLIWLAAVLAAWTPINYAIRPPAVPDRDDLLQREKDVGIAHPKEGAKRTRWGASTIVLEGFNNGITLYAAVIFFGSWFVKDLKMVESVL